MARARLHPDDIHQFRKRAADAAIHLFAVQGYDAVTMRALAAELGVSAMTPYRYLAGKEELFALVRAEAFRRFADRLEASLETTRGPLERLFDIKRAYVQFAVDDPDAYRTMFELRPPVPDLELPELLAEIRRAFGCLLDTVTDAVRTGALQGDPLTIAHLMWASTHGLVSLHLAGRLRMGRSLAALAALDHELDGLRAVPTRTGAARKRPAPSSTKRTRRTR
jgi:AcrR family transcriptional regulator